MSKGVSNSAACRVVGVNRRTGTRWRRGRTIINRAGSPKTYRPIVDTAPVASQRWLSEAERVLIADGRQAGLSVGQIAAELGRSPSTISREIRRNSDPVSGRYLPFGAHRRSVQRRSRPKSGKLAAAHELRAFVQDGLDQRWSPEQISQTLRLEFHDRPEMRVCAETIYQGLYRPALAELHRSQSGFCGAAG